MMYKIHLGVFLVAAILFIWAVFLSASQHLDGTQIIAEPVHGACEYQITGLPESGNPYRIVYHYNRWGYEPRPVLEVTSDGVRSIRRHRDERAAREGNFYPTVGGFGLFFAQDESQIVAVRDIAKGRCKGRQLYFRANASNFYRYVGGTAIIMLIYFFLFLLGAAVFEVFFRKRD